MRLWSLHPNYLDAAGLVALWRETLLAQKVLQGLTRGYTKHPQLIRFREQAEPVHAVGAYLSGVLEEADSRGYNFDRTKITHPTTNYSPLIPVTTGQLAYELEWLCSKLEKRSPGTLTAPQWKASTRIVPHPLFTTVEGDVESWERTV
ncbi:hypothetical protein J2S70_001472 [Trueperella bonasi]|uniref:DNA lyase n=1 Tax=Trueperella bonasi TaxID=312286 RepID=A0ABT9NHN8_9ACTO|nr:pyrimidine dimer DNA glycosylase/endonuclease V [Trueperella bonasi]MDP9806890.1 hypothetical protein [Trueperella bonasi]